MELFVFVHFICLFYLFVSVCLNFLLPLVAADPLDQRTLSCVHLYGIVCFCALYLFVCICLFEFFAAPCWGWSFRPTHTFLCAFVFRFVYFIVTLSVLAFLYFVYHSIFHMYFWNLIVYSRVDQIYQTHNFPVHQHFIHIMAFTNLVKSHNPFQMIQPHFS